MMPVFPAYAWQRMVKSIVITKRMAKRSLFIFSSSIEVVFAFILDFTNLDACALKKVYKKDFFHFFEPVRGIAYG